MARWYLSFKKKKYFTTWHQCQVNSFAFLDSSSSYPHIKFLDSFEDLVYPLHTGGKWGSPDPFLVRWPRPIFAYCLAWTLSIKRVGVHELWRVGNVLIYISASSLLTPSQFYWKSGVLTSKCSSAAVEYFSCKTFWIRRVSESYFGLEICISTESAAFSVNCRAIDWFKLHQNKLQKRANSSILWLDPRARSIHYEN